jgi:ribonucleotide reductase class II
MVQQFQSVQSPQTFPETAPAANPVFFRTYSRQTPVGRESWEAVCDRTVQGLVKLGQLTSEEATLIYEQQRSLKALTSGRWLWIGGTPWIEAPENFSGGYNCTSTNVTDWRSFGLMMNLAMMGCGTGAVLEPYYIEQLPTIRNPLSVVITDGVGTLPVEERNPETIVSVNGNQVTIAVGDSRQGWVDSYQTLLELSSDDRFVGTIAIQVSLGNVRPTGEALKGFGGVANPVKLPELYQRCAAILNQAVGRQLTSVECCILIDEAAIVVVAGNVRRSAGIRQFAAEDALGAAAKDNLWQQDENGRWRIDPERDALRMANHTRDFHRKPTEQELIDAVRKQFYSGEGAIQYAPEAIVRANADLFHTPELKQEFLGIYTELGREEAKGWIRQYRPEMPEDEIEHRLQRYGLNPCGK